MNHSDEEQSHTIAEKRHLQYDVFALETEAARAENRHQERLQEIKRLKNDIARFTMDVASKEIAAQTIAREVADYKTEMVELKKKISLLR